MKYLVVLTAILSMLACVSQQQAPRPASDGHSSTTVTSTSTPTPQSSWHIQDPETNPIDGTKTQFLSVGSIEGQSESHYVSGLGSIPIHKSTATVVLCFRNGKLCGGSSIGARVDIDGFVTTDGSPVRLKFDDGQAIRQQWAGSDGHNALFPYGRERQFLISLLNHKKLYFEFNKYEEAPQVVTFDIAGLSDAMKQAGLKIP